MGLDKGGEEWKWEEDEEDIEYAHSLVQVKKSLLPVLCPHHASSLTEPNAVKPQHEPVRRKEPPRDVFVSPHDLESISKCSIM